MGRFGASPVFKIAEFADGARGSVIGTVLPTTALISAPLTGRPCVYYAARIETARRRGYYLPEWRESRGVPFTIADGSGAALVEVEHSAVHLVEQEYCQLGGGSSEPPDPGTAALLARLDVTDRLEHYVVSEGVLAIGDRVRVVGFGVREADPGGAAEGYRDTPRRLRIRGTAADPLVILLARAESE